MVFGGIVYSNTFRSLPSSTNFCSYWSTVKVNPSWAFCFRSLEVKMRDITSGLPRGSKDLQIGDQWIPESSWDPKALNRACKAFTSHVLKLEAFSLMITIGPLELLIDAVFLLISIDRMWISAVRSGLLCQMRTDVIWEIVAHHVMSFFGHSIIFSDAECICPLTLYTAMDNLQQVTWMCWLSGNFCILIPYSL